MFKVGQEKTRLVAMLLKEKSRNLCQFNFWLFVSLLFLIGACSSSPQSELSDNRDPYEGLNRKSFAFNMALDTTVVEPLARGYNKSMPDRGKKAVKNHLDWAGLPATTFNSALQGDFENAGLSTIHFTINALTLGFAELTESPEEVKPQNFGQTMASYDWPQGSYLMLPFLGPETSRGLVGRVVDAVTNPLTLSDTGGVANKLRTTQVPMSAISFRANRFEAINEMKYNSLDPYARYRSVYFQSKTKKTSSSDDNAFSLYFC